VRTARSGAWLREVSDSERALAAPETTWRWRWRRAVVSPLTDVWGLGVATLALALVSGAVGGVLLSQGAEWAGRVGLTFAGLTLFAHVVLAFKAFKRDKAVQYWKDRRDLRTQLRRETAHRALLGTTLRRLRDLDRGYGSGQVEDVLYPLVDEVQAVLEADHDDVAVVLALQGETHYRVLSSTASRGSRWGTLRPGKQCRKRGSLEATLRKLAPYRRAFGVDAEAGSLQFVVLSESPLVPDDLPDDAPEALRLRAARNEILFEQLCDCLDLIVARRGVLRLAAPARLRPVSLAT
jgi:hypothetical protein